MQGLFEARPRDRCAFVVDIENADLAAALRLRPIERDVREAHKPIGLIGGGGKEREARSAVQVHGKLTNDEGGGEDLADLAAECDCLLFGPDPLADDSELVSAHSGGMAAAHHRPGDPVADLFQDRVADLMPVNVIDRLEAVEVEQAHGEGPGAVLARADSAREQRLKEAPVGETGEIVGVGDRGRGFPRVLGGLVHTGDDETGADDLGEGLGIVDEHVANEGGDGNKQRRHPVRQVVSVGEECHDERQS